MRHRLPGLGLALAVLAGLLVLASGPGYRLSWLSLGWALGLLRWGLYAAAAGAVVSVVGLALARRRRGIGTALAGLALAAAAGALPVWMRGTAASVPPIHDISTDLDDPPAFVAVLPRRRTAPNPPEHGGPEVARLQRQGYPDLASARPAVPPARVFEAALAAARDLGWTVVASEPGPGRIEATATTPWFGFTDDVVVRVRPAEGGARVDVRSVSRVGRSDLGANARRIRAFLAALARRV